MRSFLRLLVNTLLALVFFTLAAVVLLTGYALVIAPTWEYAALSDDVAQGDWLWLDDERSIYYRAWGEGQSAPVVLIHGLRVEGSEGWGELAPRMARVGLHVVAIDLEGLGRSHRLAEPEYSLAGQAEAVAAVLAALDLEAATVVGHGWGCAVALQLAHDQPQRVDRLVLLAPYMQGPQETIWGRAAEVPLLGRAATWTLASGGPLWGWEQRRDVADPAAMSAQRLAAMRAATRIVGTVDALSAMAASPAEGFAPIDAREIDAPALVLVGAADRRVPAEEARRLAESLPNGSFELLEEPPVGHYLQLEQPLALSRRLVSFHLGTESRLPE